MSSVAHILCKCACYACVQLLSRCRFIDATSRAGRISDPVFPFFVLESSKSMGEELSLGNESSGRMAQAAIAQQKQFCCPRALAEWPIVKS